MCWSLYCSAGIAIGAAIDFLLQMLNNNGNIDCINWAEVGLSGALGAIGGGWLNGAFRHSVKGLRWSESSKKWKNVSRRVKRAINAQKGTDLHHWLIHRNGAIGRYIPDSIKNHPWNLQPLNRQVHKRIHGRDLQRGLPKYNFFERWWHGTPSWAKGFESALAAGITAEALTNEGCDCD